MMIIIGTWTTICTHFYCFSTDFFELCYMSSCTFLLLRKPKKNLLTNLIKNQTNF
jgi:hypothetical protein